MKKRPRGAGKWINYPAALAGAVIMGLVVGIINADHGWWPATTAALKQAAYTFFFGGLLIKLLETIVVYIKQMVPALIISVSVTTVVTVGLVYFVHNLRGTPEPFASTVPTIILAPFGFFALAYRKRKLMAKKEPPEELPH